MQRSTTPDARGFRLDFQQLVFARGAASEWKAKDRSGELAVSAVVLGTSTTTRELWRSGAVTLSSLDSKCGAFVGTDVRVYM
jgi:hypothetical protein